MRDELDAVLAQRIDQRHAGLVDEVLDFADLEAAAAADEPSRLRPNRAPSSSAQSTTLIVTGGCWPLNIRSASRPAITPSAPSSQPPFGTESRWPPMITVRSDAPLSVAQLLPAASISGVMPSVGQLAVEPLPGVAPHRPPRQPLRAVGCRGQGRELAEIGDDVLCAHERSISSTIHDSRMRDASMQPRAGLARRWQVSESKSG